MQPYELVGKRVLIGLTYFEADGSFIEQEQLSGTVTSVDMAHSIQIELDNGSPYSLPPDLRPIQPAKPGEYRLRSTGKVVIDPDYLITYSITNPNN
jgi:hypothetical protein